jgi:hypothetical protein
MTFNLKYTGPRERLRLASVRGEPEEHSVEVASLAKVCVAGGRYREALSGRRTGSGNLV